MSIDNNLFKDLMGSFPSGVTVVTAAHDGQREGITASAFSSVSMEPKLILVCLDKMKKSCQLIRQSGGFAVNILATDQKFWGERFAGFHKDVTDRFEGREVQTLESGAPVFVDARAWMDCRLWQAYDGGDHEIFVGEVLAGGTNAEKPPILYFDRAWRGVGDPVG